MCTDTAQRYLRRILVSDFKQTKRWPIIPSLRRCQCSPPPAYLSMCTDTPQRYLRRILILDFKQKNAGRPFSFQNGFSLLWQPCSLPFSLAFNFIILSIYKTKFMPDEWRAINSWVHRFRHHGRRGKGAAESFPRKEIKASTAEGRWRNPVIFLLCDPGCCVHKSDVKKMG